ncbi:MAG TPA: hypothetical protein VIL72_10785, partial [Beijerinckiaceae bacterium]
PRLASWIGRADPEAARRIEALPVSTLDVAGAVDVSRASFSGRELAVRLDRSTFTGAVAYTAAVGGERARLFADLSSPALDVDGLPDLTGAARAGADMDLALTLSARAVRVARIGDGMVDAGRISVKLTREAGALTVERLSLENLGGATLTASARASGDAAQIEARLDAQRLVELAALLRRVAPGAASDRLAERAVALSPARLTFNAEAALRDGAVELRALRLDGVARGTRVVGSARPADGAVAAEVELASADTPMLLRQLGLESLPVAGGPRSRIVARGVVAAGGARGQVTADLAGVTLAYEGDVQSDLDGLAGAGRLRISGKDASPLLLALAVATPDAFAATPVDLTASISLKGPRLRLDDLAGEVAGARVSGALRTERREGQGPLALAGALEIDRMPLAALTALALGAPGPRKPGALWSDRPFGPALSSPPSTRLGLKIGALEVRDGLRASDVALRLAIDPGVVALDDVAMRVGAARVSGRLALRRDKQEAALAGRLDLQTTLEGRPDVAGRLRARLDLAATGASEAALMGGLAGSGGVEIAEGALRGVAPGALDAVIAAAEKDRLAADERAVVGALDKALLAGDLRLPATRFDVVV